MPSFDILEQKLKEIRYMEWDDKPVDVSAEVNFIWQVATLLHGVSYKDADHRDVILPMTVLRRLECALAPTKDAVVEYASKNPNAPDKKLEKIAGRLFFNRSPWTLEKLLSVGQGQATDLKEYIEGFSPNAKAIFTALKFDQQIDEMAKKDVLNGVIKYFVGVDLSPEAVDPIKMGYIFEDLMRKFYETAEAGKQYTGRDIIRLMVSILMSEGADDLKNGAVVVKVLDQACGTGGMLTAAETSIKHLNPEANVYLFGQEFDDSAHAIGVAEMLIKGQDPKNIRCVDSLRVDCFPDLKMRFVIENPPFGTAWGGDKLLERERDVKAENKAGGRYPGGLPSTGDSQLLFVQSAVDKMDEENGRAAIIEHAGPLYTGDAGSGESEIRRWLLRNDLIEAIIALPTDLFYNTGLQTYIWILSKNKSPRRKGKVQLIDASSFCHPLRKKLGDKKNEITAEDREVVTSLYTDFAENKFCKIFDNEDFLYREYTVMPPMRRRYEVTATKLNELRGGGAFSQLSKKPEWQNYEARLDEIADKGEPLFSRAAFSQYLLDNVFVGGKCDKAVLEKLVKLFSTPDETAEIERDRHGGIVYDEDLKDTEIVPFKESLEDYMAREVLPHLPGAKAFFEEDLTKKKPKIKTGAEFPFTRYFYKYTEPEKADDVLKEIVALDEEIAADFKALKEGLR